MINSTQNTCEVSTTRNGSVMGTFGGSSEGQSRPVVLIPGIGCGILSLELLANDLHKRGREACTIDITKARGRLGYAATMHGHAKLLREAIRERFDDQQVDIAAHSWGGVALQELALLDPDLIEHITLMATLPGGIAIQSASLATMIKMFVPLLPGLSQEQSNRISGKLYGGDFRKDRDLAEKLNIAYGADKLAYARQNFALFVSAASLYTRISRIKQKTLVMVGTDDPVTPCMNSKEIHRRIRGSSLHTVQDAGHMFPIARPEETGGVLDDFFSDSRL